MVDKVDSSDLGKKAEIRRRALAGAHPEGLLWVPFFGFGECATAAKYPADRVLGCDVDSDVIAAAREKFPEARLEVCKAERFGFPAEPFSFADFDAYGAPWKAVDHFLRSARVMLPLWIVATDGVLQKVKRSKTPYNFSTHRCGQTASLQAAEQISNYPAAVIEWAGSLGFSFSLQAHEKSGSGVSAVRYLAFEVTEVTQVPGTSSEVGPAAGDLAELFAWPNIETEAPPHLVHLYREAGDNLQARIKIGEQLWRLSPGRRPSIAD